MRLLMTPFRLSFPLALASCALAPATGEPLRNRASPEPSNRSSNVNLNSGAESGSPAREENDGNSLRNLGRGSAGRSLSVTASMRGGVSTQLAGEEGERSCCAGGSLQANCNVYLAPSSAAVNARKGDAPVDGLEEEHDSLQLSSPGPLCPHVAQQVRQRDRRPRLSGQDLLAAHIAGLLLLQLSVLLEVARGGLEPLQGHLTMCGGGQVGQARPRPDPTSSRLLDDGWSSSQALAAVHGRRRVRVGRAERDSWPLSTPFRE